MDVKRITDSYHVSSQITVADIPAIAAAGFTSIICNRPDAEIPPDQHAAVIETAALKEGLTFVLAPITQSDLTPENAAIQLETVEAANGPVLAYCRTGTRCTVLWAMGQVGYMRVDEILSTTAAAGYQLDQLRSYLTTMDSH